MMIVFLIAALLVTALLVYLLLAPSSEVRTETRIEASPERVWAVFSDFERYPEWNPYITSMRGEWKVGGKVGILVRNLDGSEGKYRPDVYEVIPNRSLVWGMDGKYPGLIKARHSFTLIPDGAGTRFIHAEKVSGWTTRGLDMTIYESTYKNFNEALKKRVEQGN